MPHGQAAPLGIMVQQASGASTKLEEQREAQEVENSTI